jgi:hypothetical protein
MANIQNVRAINTPQKSYMWEVEIKALSIGNLPELTLYAKTVSIPASSVEQIVINHKAGKTHHSGRDASGHSVTLTLWDDEKQTIFKYMHNWMALMHNPITSAGTSRDIYAAKMVIKLKDSTDTAVTNTITLGHVFPTEISDVSLSYDSSEPVEISVTFSYDEKTIS